MKIRVGYDIVYECPQPTPMVLMVNIHHSRADDIIEPDIIRTDPVVPASSYFDGFGNWCTRLVAPAGTIRLTSTGLVRDSGAPDPVHLEAQQHLVQDLPPEVLVYLLGSRYCETDLLSETAWQLFSHAPMGWARVQAICDFVHERIAFNYADARATRTAFEAFTERRGVCRDFAHLAVTLCRCMNIPARYCTGYLGDIGVPPVPDPIDFSAWFEAYLGNGWHTFDARHNQPRIGRVPIAYGRDAVDVPISNTFGPTLLKSFTVVTQEVAEQFRS